MVEEAILVDRLFVGVAARLWLDVFFLPVLTVE